MEFADPFDTPERRALRSTVAAFTARHIAPRISRWEDEGRVPLELHQQSAEAGLAGIGFAADVGGSDGDLVDTTIVIEEILNGGGTGGLIAALFTHGIATPHVVDEAHRRQGAGDQPGAERLLDEYAARCSPATRSPPSASPNPAAARMSPICSPGRHQTRTTRRHWS